MIMMPNTLMHMEIKLQSLCCACFCICIWVSMFAAHSQWSSCSVTHTTYGNHSKKFKKALIYQYLLTFPTCAALTSIPLIAVENKNGDQNHAAGQEYCKHKNKQPKSWYWLWKNNKIKHYVHLGSIG